MPESYGLLSTYPPTQCGIASFAASLVAALSEGPSPAEVGVVRVVEDVDGWDSSPPEVVHEVLRDRPEVRAAAAALDDFDVVVVQHEYGIYGGPDGQSVVAITELVRAPVVAVLHTVLADPTSHQRSLLERLCHEAAAVVVMTATAHRRLVGRYRVDPAKVEVIAHGAPTEWVEGNATPATADPLLLTWGLLGPGKGIEWVVRALAELGDLRPRYVVAGETHPHVLLREGEAYRTSIAALAGRLGVADSLTFVNRYLTRPELRALVQSADVVVLPYDSTDQVTSGVLIEAVTARRPVVATAFPHAVELLSSGAGTVVAHGDVTAMADAVRAVLTRPDVAASMVAAAARVAPDLTWAAVGRNYRLVGARLHRDHHRHRHPDGQLRAFAGAAATVVAPDQGGERT